MTVSAGVQFRPVVNPSRRYKNNNYDGNELTFIPYGLDPKLSKEAVKVHVLHGRQKQKPSTSCRRGSGIVDMQGHMFAWDSRAVLNVTKKQDKWSRERSVGGCSVALAHANHSLHVCGDLNFPLDERVLRNPFVQQIRDDLGLKSTFRINSTNYLVDHYLSRCGASRFPHELLSYYWRDTAAFKAFLAHAATLFSLETGLSPPIDVEDLMGGALHEVRKRISDPDESHSDGTTLAVAILANVEEGRLQHTNAAWHWRGLRQLLRLRGDFSSLRIHRDLHTMVLWREILTSNSTDFCFGHGIHDNPLLQHCSQHIVAFFNNFAQSLATDDTVASYDDDEMKHFLGEIVNRNDVRHCQWTCSMRRRSEIACLIYLAMLMMSAKVSVDSRKSLEKVRSEVIERDSWGAVGQDELLFIILRYGNLENEWRCQQLWQISRCIFLTRNLNMEDWKTVRDLFSLYLDIDSGCDSKEVVLEAWEGLSKRLLLEDECCKGGNTKHATGWESIPSNP